MSLLVLRYVKMRSRKANGSKKAGQSLLAKIESSGDEIVNRRVLDEVLDERLSDQRKEYERYMGAWAESLQSQISAIAEMLASVAEDMSEVKRWINEDHYRIHQRIDSRFNALEAAGQLPSLPEYSKI